MKNIYLCAPSMPFNPSNFSLETIRSCLAKYDFEATFSKNAFKNIGNTSSSVQERIEDLYEGFSNPKYDIVMSLIGGFNSNELLPHIDFKYLKKFKNKKFIGMSDMTTLCVNLYQKSEIQTFYGVQGRHFINDFDFSQFRQVASKPDRFEGFYRQKFQKNQIYKAGTMQGPLYGGNLALLCWLLGTDYELILPSDSILFLEDDDETNGYYWQMYLNHLKQAGYFKNLSGIIFGKVLDSTKFEIGSNFMNILDSVFSNINIPILIDADFGHIDNPISIPYGKNFFIDLPS